MDNQRNTVIAVVLAALVIIGWQFAIDWIYPARPETLSGGDRQTVGARDEKREQAAADRAQVRSVRDALADAARPGGAGRVAIAAPRVQGSIALRGARIDDLTLTDHRERVDKGSPPVRLFAPADTAQRHFAQFGWIGTGIETPGSDTVWRASGTRLTPATPVTLSWSNGTGQTFAIRYAIDDEYLITATQTVANRSDRPAVVAPVALVNRTSANADPDTYQLHSGPIGMFADAVSFDTNYDTVAEAGRNGLEPAGATGWIGFTDIYWMSALRPGSGDAEGRFRTLGSRVFQAELAYPQAAVAPGATSTVSTRLFAGAKEVDVLDRYEEGGWPLLSLAIDWGWFRWFEKPIFYLLHWLFTQVSNFGVAIILLTIIIRGIMFPIAQRQFASMAAMRAVQPKMKAIQDRYKDDKQKQQQEILELYKREKVNPLAGCLPIFLQIPIFFALYKVLILTIEMRHQPFALWIRDLSAPDPLTPVNLFGLLPFDPPTFLAIGVLPIILGITMWLQFRLQPAAMDPVQQQVFAIMPWMMMVFMAPFAAGLQLYWSVSNLLTIAQQSWLYSRHPQLKEQMKAEAAEKAAKARAAASDSAPAKAR